MPIAHAWRGSRDPPLSQPLFWCDFCLPRNTRRNATSWAWADVQQMVLFSRHRLNTAETSLVSISKHTPLRQRKKWAVHTSTRIWISFAVLSETYFAPNCNRRTYCSIFKSRKSIWPIHSSFLTFILSLIHIHTPWWNHVELLEVCQLSNWSFESSAIIIPHAKRCGVEMVKPVSQFQGP